MLNFLLGLVLGVLLGLSLSLVVLVIGSIAAGLDHDLGNED